MALTLPLVESGLLLETKTVLQNYTRAVSSFSSQFILLNKIRKENTLKVSHRGLTTQSIPYYNNDELIYFEMEIDFHVQSLWVRLGEEERQIPFTNNSENEFYFKLKELLNNLGFNLKVELNTFNDETRYNNNPEAVDSILKILHFADFSFRLFRSELNEITSSVQFRPQSFDLVLNIFCGQPITMKDAISPDERLGYIKLGFSFGDEKSPEPYFYAHVSPFSQRMKKSILPPNARWSEREKKMIELPYAAIVGSEEPIVEVVSFYKWVYNEYLTGEDNK